MFTITVTEISETSKPQDTRIVKAKGTISQYPDWDEDEWDDDWEDE